MNYKRYLRWVSTIVVLVMVGAGCGRHSDQAGFLGSPPPDLAVVDNNNSRVLGYQQPFINGMAAQRVIGQPDFTSGSCNQGGSRGPTTLCFPQSVAQDPSGNGWVGDSDNDRVLMFTSPFTTGMAASVVLGEPDFVTDTGCSATTASTLCFPSGVASDKNGNIWVADDGNCRVLEFMPPFTNGMAASVVLGQANFTDSCVTTTGQNGMNSPEFLTFDNSGNLWVSDDSNNRVLEFTPPFTNGMNAALVIGQPDFTTTACNTDQNGLCSPEGVAFDSSGNLWVGDDGNCRALEFVPPFSTNMPASVVLGQPDFTSDCVTTSGQAGLDDAVGVGFASDRLYVSDFDNNRVMQFAAPFSNGMNANEVFGQPDFSTTTPNTTQHGLDGPLGVRIGNTP